MQGCALLWDAAEQWCGGRAGTCNADSECRDEFYTDPMAAQYYRDHVSTILNRRNTINGRLYRWALTFCPLHTDLRDS